MDGRLMLNMRNYDRSGKHTTLQLSVCHAAYAFDQGGGSHVDLFALTAEQSSLESTVYDLVETLVDLLERRGEILDILNPFKIGYDHTAGISYQFLSVAGIGTRVPAPLREL